MSRATIVGLAGVGIALAAISWAVPIFGAAHLVARSTTVVKNEPSKLSAKVANLPGSVPAPVRFREVRDRGLLVKAWINGEGPYTFAIDTGAGINVIAQSLVVQAKLPVITGKRTLIGGLAGVGAVSDREAVIDQIALGEQFNLLPSPSAAVIVPHLPSDIDGILDPTEAYSPLGYSIDLPNRYIEAFNPNTRGLNSRDPSPEGTIVRWVRGSDSRRPFVRLGDGRLALIDTGSGFGLAVSGPGVGLGAKRNGEGVRDLGGGIIHSRRVAPSTVSVGSLVLRGVPTDILSGVEKGAPVILGRDALYPFRITFDPVQHLIEIAPPRENQR